MRIYDPRLGRFLSVDPIAAEYPWYTPYQFAGNNPIYYVDVNGEYKYPAELAAEYFKNYPALTNYLMNNVQSDIMKSETIKLAFLKYTDGNLTSDKLIEATTWNSGPIIKIVDHPGGENAFGGEGANGKYWASTNTIEINTAFATQLERVLNSKYANDEAKQAAIFSLFVTLVHETTHYGDYLDGKQSEGEVGADLSFEVFESTEVEVINDNSDGSQEKKVVRPGFAIGNNRLLSNAKALIKANKDVGKTDIYPTVPSTSKPTYTPPPKEEKKKDKSKKTKQ
jgi:Metallopeptidase toxin 3